jgi:hypothetical protein
MADITKCRGEGCPVKKDCYRYNAKSSEYRQSYFIKTPYNIEENKCEHFWDRK